MLLKLKAGAAALVFAIFIFARMADGIEDAPPVGLAKQMVEDSSFTWVMVKAPHFRFYYESNTYAAKHFAMLRRAAEEARLHALEILGEDNYAPTIDLFYLDSRDKMFPIIGFRPKGWTEAESNTVLLACNDNVRAYHRHEIMHNISMNLWGMPPEPNACLVEGLAVFADALCLSFSLHEIAADLQKQQKLIQLDTLINKFREQDDMTAYMESGSLVHFIYKHYGRDKFKALWQKGFARFSEVMGKNLNEVDLEWRRFLQRIEPGNKKVNWQLLAEKGCG